MSTRTSFADVKNVEAWNATRESFNSEQGLPGETNINGKGHISLEGTKRMHVKRQIIKGM